MAIWDAFVITWHALGLSLFLSEAHVAISGRSKHTENTEPTFQSILPAEPATAGADIKLGTQRGETQAAPSQEC